MFNITTVYLVLAVYVLNCFPDSRANSTFVAISSIRAKTLSDK